jgi:hypothetical protein
MNACKKDPEPVNEEEVITTVILSLQKSGSSTVQNIVFNDPDGDGGISATTDSIIIEKAAIYNATITLLKQLSITSRYYFKRSVGRRLRTSVLLSKYTRLM